MSGIGPARYMAVAAVLIALGGQSAAQPAAEGKPWEKGISDEQRQRSLRLFRQGNKLFANSEYRSAAQRYRSALAIWNHPRIHGNLGTTLIHLDDSLAAMKHIKQALSYGATPFQPHVYEQLRINRKLLLGQLATIEIKCDRDGVTSYFDGETLLVGRGSRQFLTIAGRHQVIGRKKGHRTYTRVITAIGGRTTSVQVQVLPLVTVTHYKRKWATWKPWAVVAGGMLVAAIGIPLRSSAELARDQYEQEIATACPRGCDTSDLPPPIAALPNRVRTLNALEISAYIVGGAIAAVGGVLAFVNRNRAFVVTEVRPITAMPWVSQGRVGVAIGLNF